MTESQPQQEECPPPRTREAVDCWLRKWGRDAAVNGTEPLTREDVERLIKANGGTAEGLDLSRRDMRGPRYHLSSANLQGATLSGANLQDSYLGQANLQDAYLSEAKLQGAILWRANLQRADLSNARLNGAMLLNADLKLAKLDHANLQDANFTEADLQGADLTGMQISTATNLGNVKWHEGYVLPSERKGLFTATQSTCRSLKTWHQEHGFYDIAGEFHHREMVCRRKGNQQDFTNSLQKTRNPWRLAKSLLKARWSALAHALVMAFYEQLFGYGERPWRVVRAAVIVVLGLAAAYRYFGTFVEPDGTIVEPVRFIDALYYSAVSFSAVGYGSWVHQPQGWARYMGVAESFLGVFTIALFLVTFTRKMVR